VATKDVDDRVLGEPQPVVHAEPVWSLALGVVEVDLLADAHEQRAQAVDQVAARVRDALTLRRVERVAGRLGYVTPSR
jgi:hypothetical protein